MKRAGPQGKAPTRIRPISGRTRPTKARIRPMKPAPTKAKARPRNDSAVKPIYSHTGELLFRGTEAEWRKWAKKRKANGEYEAELRRSNSHQWLF